ncbi:MAG TPA: hypothetical protein VGQ81_05225 [Acidobacteriota bacterium]|nr:hypothetical protein [Acidobacteriota bacterium]
MLNYTSSAVENLHPFFVISHSKFTFLFFYPFLLAIFDSRALKLPCPMMKMLY